MQQYVDHSYNDFSMVDDDELRLLDENASLLPPAPPDSNVASARDKLSRLGCTYGPMKKNSGGVVQPFPGKVSDFVELQLVVSVLLSLDPSQHQFLLYSIKLFAFHFI